MTCDTRIVEQKYIHVWSYSGESLYLNIWFIYLFITGFASLSTLYRGHGGRVVTLSLAPTSEAGVRFPAQP